MKNPTPGRVLLEVPNYLAPHIRLTPTKRTPSHTTYSIPASVHAQLTHMGQGDPVLGLEIFLPFLLERRS